MTAKHAAKAASTGLLICLTAGLSGCEPTTIAAATRVNNPLAASLDALPTDPDLAPPTEPGGGTTWILQAPPPFALVPHKGLSMHVVPQTDVANLVLRISLSPDFASFETFEREGPLPAGEPVHIDVPDDHLVSGQVYYWHIGAADDFSDSSPVRSFTVDAGRLHNGWGQSTGWHFAHGSVPDTDAAMVLRDAVTLGYDHGSYWHAEFHEGAALTDTFDRVQGCINFCGLLPCCGALIVGDELEVYDESLFGGASLQTHDVLAGAYQRVDLAFRLEPPSQDGGEHNVVVALVASTQSASKGPTVVFQKQCGIVDCQRQLLFLPARSVSSVPMAFQRPVPWNAKDKQKLSFLFDHAQQQAFVVFNGEVLHPAVPYHDALSDPPQGIQINTSLDVMDGDGQSRTFFSGFDGRQMSTEGIYYSAPVHYSDGPQGKEGWGSVALWAAPQTGSSSIGINVQFWSGTAWDDVPGMQPQAEDAIGAQSVIDLQSLDPEVYAILRFAVSLTRDASAAPPQLERLVVEWRGQCLHQADAVLCDDNDACTHATVCSAGMCVPGEITACLAPGPCEVSLGCMPDTGICAYEPAFENSACASDDLCVVNAVCNAGSCVGQAPACVPPSPCMQAVGCDSLTGDCEFLSLGDGEQCDDDNPCTQNTTCFGGACLGAAVDCSAVGTDPCQRGVCVAQGNTPTCVAQPAPAGSYCPDGDLCNGVERCDADGQCSIAGEPGNCAEPQALRLRAEFVQSTVGQPLRLTVQAIDAAGHATVGAMPFCVHVFPGGMGSVRLHWEVGEAGLEGGPFGIDEPLCLETYEATGNVDLWVVASAPNELLLTLWRPEAPVADDQALLTFMPGAPARLRFTPLQEQIPACSLAPVLLELLDERGNRALMSAGDTSTIFMRLVGEGAEGAQFVETTLQGPSPLPADTLQGSFGVDFGIAYIHANTAAVFDVRGESASLSTHEARATLEIVKGVMDASQSLLTADVTSFVAGEGSAPVLLQLLDSCGAPLTHADIQWQTNRGRMSAAEELANGHYRARLAATAEQCGGTAVVRPWFDGMPVGEGISIMVACPAAIGSSGAARRGCNGGGESLSASFVGLLVLGARRRRQLMYSALN